jgi:hypothetical protein
MIFGCLARTNLAAEDPLRDKYCRCCIVVPCLALSCFPATLIPSCSLPALTNNNTAFPSRGASLRHSAPDPTSPIAAHPFAICLGIHPPSFHRCAAASSPFPFSPVCPSPGPFTRYTSRPNSFRNASHLADEHSSPQHTRSHNSGSARVPQQQPRYPHPRANRRPLTADRQNAHWNNARRAANTNDVDTGFSSGCAGRLYI